MCHPRLPFINHVPGRFYVNGDVYIYRRETTSTIKLAKLHRFAADRWLAAKTVERAKFWKGVMDWCVEVKVRWRLPNFDEFLRDNPHLRS